MADNKQTPVKQSPVSLLRTGEDGRPESPTTAQPLDFDDDLDSATPTRTTAADTVPKPPPKDEVPPPKPPRPLSPREQAENTLREAFPTIDASVVRAVLNASSGQLEPAFNALLGMSDPDSQREIEPAAQPQRQPRETSVQQSQLEADEMYARQLQEHFANSERSQQPTQRQGYNQHLQGSRVGRPGAPGGGPTSPNTEERSEWRAFVDEDLPEIRENIRKGFVDTQSTVNRWISNFKKQLDGEDTDDFHSQKPQQGQNIGRQGGFGRPGGDTGRRSADLARYDADPQVIGDDFSKLDLRDGEHPPRTSSRPAANPNLFKTDSDGNRRKSVGRKVSFQDGPPEEIQDMYSSSKSATGTTTVETSTPSGPGTTNKASKWQPLAKADPSPVQEHDPFSLGDSEDEQDAKPIQMKDTVKDDEDERLKQAMSEAASDSIGTDTKDTTAETKK